MYFLSYLRQQNACFFYVAELLFHGPHQISRYLEFAQSLGSEGHVQPATARNTYV